MSSIHYTNAVLTIIALALSVIAVENIVRPSHYTNAVLTIIALVLSVIAVENIVRPSAAKIEYCQQQAGQGQSC
jgi:cyanate permease